MAAIQVRVSAKTEADEYRCIYVEGDLTTCDCGGFDGDICSHIDAVLLAGERFMVHPDDLREADIAMGLVAGKLERPDSWKGAWRRNLRWRGLSRRTVQRRPVSRSGRPIVCFTGDMLIDGVRRPRKDLLGEAEAAGWETVDSPNRSITVLVAADPLGNSRKLVEARKHAIPIVAFDDWPTVMIDGVFPE